MRSKRCLRLLVLPRIPQTAAPFLSLSWRIQPAARVVFLAATRRDVLVVPLTPTLIQEDPDNDENRQLNLFADFIRAEAKRRALPLADCRRAEVDALVKLPQTGERHFTYDGIHPVAAGHRLIAREVIKALGVPENLKPQIEEAWDRFLAE